MFNLFWLADQGPQRQFFSQHDEEAARSSSSSELPTRTSSPIELQTRTSSFIELQTAPVLNNGANPPPTDVDPPDTSADIPETSSIIWFPGRFRRLRQVKKRFTALKPAPKEEHKETTSYKPAAEWHLMPPELVAETLRTSPDVGLSTEEAARRLLQNGPNAPSQPQTNKALTIFGYFFRGFGSILLVGSILVFICWKPLGEPPAKANLALAIVMLAVFFTQAFFNMFQDWTTSLIMASITDLLPRRCDVVRNAQQMTIEAKDLVMGDVVVLTAGKKAPADLRYTDVSADVMFDRSAVTGESVEVEGSLICLEDRYAEARNIGLQGTVCTYGTATGLVVATGDATIFGHVASATNRSRTKPTTLEKEVKDFVSLIMLIMAVTIIAVVLIWGCWLRKSHPRWINIPTLIVDCVSVAVAFIPEGLPIAITAGLTITATLMMRSNILCKSLKTVESLGVVSVICTDKTGTVTQGKMTISDFAVGLESMTRIDGYHKSKLKIGESSVKLLGAMSLLCNAAYVERAGPLDDRPLVIGDATDTAIVDICSHWYIEHILHFRACWTEIGHVAFNSRYKFSVRCYNIQNRDCLAITLPEDQALAFREDDVLLTVKGAPDVLLPHCRQYVSAEGVVLPFDEDAVRQLGAVRNELSLKGRRCIAVAYRIVPPELLEKQDGRIYSQTAVMAESQRSLVLAGLFAIHDPLRPKIRSVIKKIRRAGIKVPMVTGDFALTALAIAREAGIMTHKSFHDVRALIETPPTDPNATRRRKLGWLWERRMNSPFVAARAAALVISGPELERLNPYQWKQVTCYEEIIFARTTPEQKLQIVQAFQERNVVGMTGDGVNDAPSLKAADVGICVGSGCDLAKEAADMVLLDDFCSIVPAVLYGRLVFDNLKKVIAYLLPAGSFSEFWPVMASVVFGLPQILSSFLMIVICCLTDCVAAMMLSYETPEADVLRRPPRNPKKERLVNAKLMLHAYGLIGVIETISSFAMAFNYLKEQGIPFREMFMGFGRVPDGVDEAVYNAKLKTASSIYFVNLVMMQWFNLLAVRTRRLSVFRHRPFGNKKTQNLWLFAAILFSFTMALIFVYVPPLQKIIGTAPVPGEYWIYPSAGGLLLILVDETRRYVARMWPKGIVARLAW